ncbi:MAG: hypothetical protein IKR11_01140, partial [Solobacterium sp.]|nr:hypothetical protein [Solobacterium sp.]
MKNTIKTFFKYYLLMNLFCMAFFANKNAYTVFASEGNPYPHSYTEYDEEGHEIYHPGNCTWQAWEECYNRLGIRLPSWGNGGTWHSSAEQAGYSYTEWETGSHYENCIVEWNHHVAWLISCDENGADIVEGNLRQDGEYRERVEKWWSWNDLKNRWGEGTPYIIFLNVAETEESQEKTVHEFDAKTVDTEITEVTEDENKDTDEQNAEINGEEEQPVEETASESDVDKNEMPDLLHEGTELQETTEEPEERPMTQTDIFKEDTHSLLMEGANITETATVENIEEEIPYSLDIQKAEMAELLTEGFIEAKALEMNDTEEQSAIETDPRKIEILSLLKEGFDEEKYLKRIAEEEA